MKIIKLSLFLLSLCLFIGCSSDGGSNSSTITVPKLSTTAVSSIGPTFGTGGGKITSDGGAPITARGVVWSILSSSPTVSLITKTVDGTGTGTFTSDISSGLTTATTYYVRAYATNSAGTGYGNKVSFITHLVDIDGHSYPIVRIGTQLWMQENLNVSKYRNGDPIPQVTDPSQWANLTTGAWCYYENITANGTVYGKLYNWYALNDPRKLAPAGWHVPTDNEWTALTTFLGGELNAGGKMKSITGWDSPNTLATNSSGFTALPGGSYDSDGIFEEKGSRGFWWSANESSAGSVFAHGRILFYSAGNVSTYNYYKDHGMSVRCIKD